LHLRKQSLTAGLPRNGRSSTYLRLSGKQSSSLGGQSSSALPWEDQVALTRELQELIKCTSLAVASQDPDFFADTDSQPLNEPLSATKTLGLRQQSSTNQVSVVHRAGKIKLERSQQEERHSHGIVRNLENLSKSIEDRTGIFYYKYVTDRAIADICIVTKDY